ncbi:HDIG domain-containing metalloprotein [uncultured Desulfuromusa sp.]|uniref:HD family phosphohydrolase n=1 Tax=uncultured Desulfuromusa sp. TaxID=219183 RepID=UPI002AA72C9F|nr:HDIG domain-containing metalloprotein [uncultured Desulfuromusa sp.]
MTKEEKDKSLHNRTSILSGGVQGLRNRQQPRLGGWLLVFVAALLTLIIVPKGGLIPDYYSPGDIATRNIKSPRDLLVEDTPLTQAKRDEAEKKAPFVYGLDSTAGEQAVARIRQGLGLLVQLQEDVETLKSEEFQLQLESNFGIPLDGDEILPLFNLALNHNIAALTGDLLTPIFQRPVVANFQAFEGDRARGILVVDTGGGEEVAPKILERVIGLNEALLQVKSELGLIPGITAPQEETLFKLVQQQLRPNLVFDQIKTKQGQVAAREQIAPVFFQVKKGEMVVREGERITTDQILKLQEIRRSGRDNRSLQMAAGLLICSLLLIYVGFYFTQSNISKFRPDSRDLLFLTTVFLFLFLMIKVSIFVVAGMENTFSYFESSVYFYAVPFALGAMLVRIVLNSETALLFAVCSSMLVGVLFGNSLLMALYVLVGSLVGSHGVRHCQQRTTLYRAGLWIGLSNMALLVGIHFLSGRSFELSLLWKLGFGFFGGLVNAVVVNGTVPLAEYLFKYTTDIKLLELANMNAPILRQLMIEAPGTYHHSILVGNLGEAAAEAINANPLLTRVSAYYHDIGKIKKPLYFIENSGGQRNKHDKLSPSMSALILTSHVKDGVDLAKEHKLGSELIEIIQQHHGTTLIKFFYDRAKSQADPGVQQIDERDYRYHGPKPQSREAALIMLADAVEAASRTLSDPTPARIQGMVQKLINNIFIDGQLNECDLTLKDLNLIAKSFNRILAGSFHQRVDYPEPVHIVREESDVEEKTPVKEKAKIKSANPDRKPPKTTQDPEAATAEGSSEDLKRLGMS